MTTMTVTVQDMQQRLPELLSQVSNGKTIIIEKNKKPLARLVGIESKSMKRIVGLNRGEPAINAQRIALRLMEGGHDVPIPKIINRYYRSITNCVDIMAKVDRTYFYDNSETNVDPSLVFRVSDGKITKIYREMVPWAKSIADLFPPS